MGWPGPSRGRRGWAILLAPVPQQSISDLNLEFARRGYAAFNEGGVEGILPFLEPDIEWVNLHPAPMKGTYHGHEGVRRYFQQLEELFEGLRLEPEDFIAVGDDYVLVFLRVRGRGKETGVEGTVPVANLWKVGKTGAAEVKLYYDRGEALEAAGLASQDPPK